MLIEICLLGIGLYTGSKVYKKRQKAESVNKQKENRSEHNVVCKSQDTTCANSQASSSAGNLDYLPEKRTNQYSNATNKYLAVTSVSTGLTAMGRLYYSPLIPLGAIGLIYPLSGMLKKAYDGLFKERKLNMEVMGSILVPGMVFTGYYFTACFSLCLYYVSLKLLNKIEDNTRKNLTDIFKNQYHSVWVVNDGIEIEVPLESLQTGDIVSVKTGESIPVDGIITDGIASIDQHILTAFGKRDR
ncbi:MAG: hypothetical protein HQK77_06795 [Desulfobacterales bacterium]|nr:hypothetical protein [Desulfobacterales bacterium]